VAALIRSESTLEKADGFEEAVIFGLKGCSNVRGASGEIIDCKLEVVNGEERLSAATLNELHYPTLISELGAQVFLASMLTPTNGQASP
jgi:hypothetical protein